MRCKECADYQLCRQQHNLRKWRTRCPIAKNAAPPKPETVAQQYRRMDRECKGCWYRRRMNGKCTDEYCAHLLITGRRRDIGENGECLSKKTRKNGGKVK